MKVKIVKKHPLWVRWNHWINFPVLTIMVWSGFLIYWASPEYLLPGRWLAALGMDYQLARGMSWHFAFGVLFVFNGLCYVLYLLFSGQWRFLLPEKGSLREGLHVLLHDLHLRKDPPPPTVKYNGAQRWTYTCILVVAVIAVLTGFSIYKPIQLHWLAQMFGGYTPARWIHFFMAWTFIAFFIVHVIQVLRSGWNSLRAMITGWERKDD